MKLVYNFAELAEALGKTPEELAACQHALESLGFPRPVRGLADCWSIIEVMRWVNRDSLSVSSGPSGTCIEEENFLQRTGSTPTKAHRH
jgi:hypothetical protein